MSRVLGIFFLFLFQLARTDPGNEINSTENFISGDVESLATVNGCVNVVSGSFFQVDTDLVVDGPEPLRFIRCYDSGHLLNSVHGFGFGSQYPLRVRAFGKGKKYYHAAIEMQEGSYLAFKGTKPYKSQKKINFALDVKIFKSMG